MNAIKSVVRNFLRLVFEVLEEIVSLLIAAWLLYYTNIIAPQQQGNMPLLLDGILLIVGLVAISNLRDRLYRFRKIQEAVDKTRQEVLDRTIYKNTGPDEFFSGKDEFYDKFLSTSSSIDISGITLTGTVHTYSDILGKRLKAASHIRIIILDPESDDALRQLVLRSWSNVAKLEYYRDALRHTSELIENIGNTSQTKGSLEIGYLPFVPSFGISILQRGQVDSLAFIKFYHHLTNTSPGFFADASTAPKTFQLYKDQFSRMWKACKTHKIV